MNTWSPQAHPGPGAFVCNEMQTSSDMTLDLSIMNVMMFPVTPAREVKRDSK